MPNSDTFVVRFAAVDDQKVVAAFTRVDKAAGKVTTTTTKQNAAGQDLIKTTKIQAVESQNLANKLVYLAAKYLVMTVVIRAAMTALQGLARWTVDTAKIAIDANESWNLINVTFGNLKKNLDEWGRSSSATILQTTRQAEQQAAKFFLVAQSMGAARGEAFELSKKLTVLAQDLASFRNLEPEAAFQAVYRGIIGQPRLLLSAGVGGMGVNEVKTEADRLGVGLDAYGKMVSRVSILTRALGKDTGDVVRTQYEMANALRGLNAAYLDAREQLGSFIGSNVALGGTLIGVADAVDDLTASILGMNSASRTLTKVSIGAWAANAGMLLVSLGEAAAIAARSLQMTLPGQWNNPTNMSDLQQIHDDASKMRVHIGMGFVRGAFQQIQKDLGLTTIGTAGNLVDLQPPGGDGGGTPKKSWLEGLGLPPTFGLQDVGEGAGGDVMGRNRQAWNRYKLQGAFGTVGGGISSALERTPDMLYMMRNIRPGMAYGSISGARHRFPLQTQPWFMGLPGTDDSFGGRDSTFGEMFGGKRRGKYDLRNIHFGQQDWATVASAGISGGAGGALGALGSIAGSAFGPLGGLLGGLLGGGLGRLFHKKKQDAGLTPSQPLYTKDVQLSEMLNELLNVTKIAQLRGAGRGIDSMASGVRMQYARAGV